MKKIYDKLVRDKIPDILAQKGIAAQYHPASLDEYKRKLLDKLGEEVAEFKKNPNLDELADILEVVLNLPGTIGHSANDLEAQRKKKLEERGGFFRKIILEWTEEK